MSDLERYFDGRVRSGLSAQDIFTDRVSEQDAFYRSLAAWRASRPRHRCREDSPVENVNVLSYYGVGGVGKTRLSMHLQETFESRRYAGAPKRVRAIRIDFDDPGFLDLESVVLALRGWLTSLAPRWDAFDLALASYWVRAHPGTPYQSFVSKGSVLAEAEGALKLGNQIALTVQGFVGELPGAVASHLPVAQAILDLGGALHRAIRQRMRNHRLAKELPILEEMLGQPAPKLLQFLPALLAADLERLSERERADVVVFLDTFEQVQNASGVAGDIEDSIARLIYLMPNVLFVVTGRNRLTWGDGDVPGVAWSGTERWPLLSALQTEEPRQHLVGMLSERDARQYLSERLTKGDRPAMPQEIVDAIVDGEAQLPLYLDLCAVHYEELVAQGRPPAPSDFAGSFTEVVLRLMKDLSDLQRGLLRAAALARWFNPDLIAAGVPPALVGQAEQLSERALFERDPLRHFSVGLHDRLADSINRHQHRLDDRWAEQDVAAAADRMLDCLTLQLRTAMDEPENDRRVLVEGTPIAFRLAAHARDVPDWFFELAYALRSIWA